MDRILITSSNIKSVGYDKDSQILEIEFNNGNTYQYIDVSSYVYQSFLDAESKGKFFHKNIKNKYTVGTIGI